MIQMTELSVRDLDVFTDGIEVLLSDRGVTLCYLYGSYARGTMTGLSDLDIGVVLSSETTRDKYTDIILNLTSTLSRRLTDIDVDVRVLNDAPVEFRYNVIANGQLIFCSDDIIRARFETETIRVYLDFRPVLDTYYQYMHRRLEEADHL